MLRSILTSALLSSIVILGCTTAPKEIMLSGPCPACKRTIAIPDHLSEYAGGHGDYVDDKGRHFALWGIRKQTCPHCSAEVTGEYMEPAYGATQNTFWTLPTKGSNKRLEDIGSNAPNPQP